MTKVARGPGDLGLLLTLWSVYLCFNTISTIHFQQTPGIHRDFGLTLKQKNGSMSALKLYS